MQSITLQTEESTVTDRYQTTVPKLVREALHLNKRDKIRYALQSDGSIVLSRVGEEKDAILERFLEFLSEDIRQHPEQLQAIDQNLFQRVKSLIANVEVDLDAPLADEDE